VSGESGRLGVGAFAVEPGREEITEGVAVHGSMVVSGLGRVPRSRRPCDDGAVDDLTRLALAARAGDRVALAAFVRRAQPEVWRLCAHLSDRDAADDLTQDTFLRAIGALGSFRGDATARTWLLSIARRACADHVRRRVRGRNLLDRIVNRAAPPGDEPERTGEVDLDHAVAALTPDRRDAFVLTQVLGLSYEEAADVCGCPVGTIRSRVSRARTDLVSALSDDASSATG
jgi:RNA polymerase sigma-70 factor (ECF subfamily)